MDAASPPPRFWRSMIIAGVAVVGIHDVVIFASSFWASFRKSSTAGNDDKRGKPRRPKSGSDSTIGRAKNVGRRLVLLYLPLRVFDWFRGEDRRGDEEFFCEEKSTSPTDAIVEEPRTQVLFFPDDGIPCKDYYNSRAGCPRDKCPFLHEVTAYQRLIDLLRGARASLDVCVFCITCADLVSVLIDRQCNGNVAVRVITDSEQLRVTGSQIGKLRNEGVRVRHDNTSYLMHHKFAIIDGKTVLNGSFNWTRTAITGNHENLVISREEYLVRAFSKEFESLWVKFHPKHQKGFSEKPSRDTWVTADYMR